MYGDTIGTSRMRGFTHNADDRMIRVDMLEGFESVSQFEYDAMGRRLISTDNDDNKTLYYYDGIRVILEKTKPSGSGTWSTSQVYTLQEGAIGFIASSRDTATGDDTWYHYDRLGTVMNLSNATGAVIATYSQDAFGNILSGSSDGFHLTTKRHYSDIGLYYFFYRWYDPEVGRFVQRSHLSPIYEHQYNFVANSPLGDYDPSGKISIGGILKNIWKCIKKGLKIKDAADTTQDGCDVYKECCELSDQTKSIDEKKKDLERIKEKMKAAPDEDYPKYQEMLDDIGKSIADQGAGLCTQIGNCIEAAGEFIKDLLPFPLPFRR